MELSCLQENLSKGLSIVGRAVPSRTTMPILRNVLLSTDQGQLKLATTNLELGIVHRVGARVTVDGALTIPARNFIDLVNSLPAEPVELVVEESTQTLRLVCGRVQASFRGIDSEEFPVIPEPQGDANMVVEAGELRKALAQVTFAASNDESQKVLTGVLAEFEGQTLTLVAADGFRLSVRDIPLLHPISQSLHVIIPARAMSELSRIIGTQEEPVEISTTQPHNQVLFNLEDTVLNTQLIDGRYPDYRRIIPQDHTITVTMGRAEILQACKRAEIFARDATNIVKLTITADEMIVAADSVEMGQGSTRLAARVDGPEMEIAFNVRFLIDVFSAIDTPQIVLELTSPQSPGVVKGGGDESFLHVVMPMQLSR